jgi:Concanavalin A-like lectin/glucanases superfamily
MAGALQLLLRIDPSTGLPRDYSSYGHTIELLGGVAISAAQPHFGLNSMAFNSAASARVSIQQPYPNFMALDTLTVEAWVFRTGSAPNSGRIVQLAEGDVFSPISMSVDSSGQLTCYATNTGNSWTTGLPIGGLIPLNQWCHVAAVRSAGLLKLYLNGVNTVSAACNGIGAYGGPAKLNIGGQATGVIRTFPGYIAEVRITAFDAKYGANFSVPTAPLLAEDISMGTRSILEAHGAVSMGVQGQQPGPPAAKAIPPTYGRRNIYQGGGGEISGTTTLNGVVYPRKQVRLFNKKSALLVAETWSDNLGAYTFKGIDPTQDYFVISHDETGAQEAVAKDRVKP